MRSPVAVLVPLFALLTLTGRPAYVHENTIVVREARLVTRARGSRRLPTTCA